MPPWLPNWEASAVPQKHSGTGCIPTGFEFLLRYHGVEGIDFDPFQDEFNLELSGLGPNSFRTVADAITHKYPHVSFEVIDFPTGQQKIEALKARLSVDAPTIASIARDDAGHCHIMPVVGADAIHVVMLDHVVPGSLPQMYKATWQDIITIHDNWPGGSDIAFLKFE